MQQPSDISESKSIQKGFYLKARKIDNSAIAHTSPHIREIWDWLIKNANYCDKITFGKTISRGQIFTSYKEIIDGLHWMVGYRRESYSKSQCEIAMKWLVKHEMITTTKTTRGLIITICKYDTYQRLENYDNHTETYKRTTREPQCTDTIQKEVLKNNKEDNNRGEGDLHPLHASPPVGLTILPDGRGFIEPTVFFTSADFNGLPEKNTMALIRFMKTVKSVSLEQENVTELWEVFKDQELTEQKPYRNKDDVYRHFLNWTKKQTFKNGTTQRVSRTKPVSKSSKPSKIVGLKFINDFTQCKMTDGSIQDLDINQQDSAKYNLINPSSIIKTN